MPKNLASIRMYSVPEVEPSLKPPPSTGTHFGTAGRVLSFFPKVNKNGYTFEEENVPDELIKTLVGSTVDIEHLKPGYGAQSRLIDAHNTTFGSIVAAKRVPGEGVDIACKLERSIAAQFGFASDDFAPGKLLGQYSQECDYKPEAGSFIVVDKSDPTKIISRIPYADGVAIGLSTQNLSHVEGGEWKYVLHEGNPLYFSVTPTSFSGTGHVLVPADDSAVTYKLAAALNIANAVSVLPEADRPAKLKELLAGYEGVGGSPFPAELTNLADTTDLNAWTGDFLTHPDILTAEVDHLVDHDNKDGDNTKLPDSHFAAVFSQHDYSTVTNGDPLNKKTRAFRIKNDKGEFDRKRLIAAYRSLVGMRGCLDLASSLPSNVKFHALALVRQGLKETQPKKKENSSIMDPEIEVLNRRIQEMTEAATKMVSKADHDAVIAERDQLKALVATLTADKATLVASVTDLTAKVNEHEAKALSSARLSQLEAVHPFTKEEKEAETFTEFVKSLSALSEDGFAIKLLQRDNARLTAALNTQPQRVLSSVIGRPATNPIPPANAGRGDETDTVSFLY